MPHDSVKQILPAPSEVVFPLLHDYNRRMKWDTLLKSAKLCDGASEAGVGVTSVCTGKWYLGGIAMVTEYVTFIPPRVAAVKLVSRPRLFESFAATIRHDNPGGWHLAGGVYLQLRGPTRVATVAARAGDGGRVSLGDREAAEGAGAVCCADAGNRGRLGFRNRR